MSGPFRRNPLLEPAASFVRALHRIRARGPRLGRYEPECTLTRDEHLRHIACHAAVDFHTHLGRWLTRDGTWMEPDVGALLALMDDCNLTALVNLDGRWGDELEANLDRYDRAYPGRFFTFCHVDWSRVEHRGGIAQLVADVERSAAAGARGLKVWKDLGLTVSVAGRLLLPDDELLAPVWEAAGALGLPVLIHTGDPVAFFQPVDRRNERFEELRRHPSIRLARGDFATFQRLVGSLESLVAQHRTVTFIGAHVGCYAENLPWVAGMLERYPNFWIDLSSRAAELGRQPRAAARLIERFADRVLFGTDTFPLRKEAYEVYFRLLETDDDHFPYAQTTPPPNGRWAIYGLGLSDPTLRRVYAENARRILAVAQAPGAPVQARGIAPLAGGVRSDAATVRSRR
jgi:predicted TIM-barrel fold metal-dependent hydrolase